MMYNSHRKMIEDTKRLERVSGTLDAHLYAEMFTFAYENKHPLHIDTDVVSYFARKQAVYHRCVSREIHRNNKTG